MKSLNISFREFFSVYSMFFSERKVYSDFSLMEVDVCEGSLCRWSRIESESKFTYHNFSFELNNPIIEFCKLRREVVTRKNSSIFDIELKRFTYFNRKIFTWIGIDKAFSIHIFKIYSFRKSFSNRKCSTLVY